VKRPGRRDWLPWLFALLLLTFAVYIPSLRNGFTNWDDNYYVTENPLVAHPDFQTVLTTPVASNYHPLTIWSYALNYRISGLNPASYHWLNLLLHLANTSLVFLFVWRLSKGRLWTTVATSLLFGIHPMHVESVAWIAERKDVLYAFFYLAGLIAYLRYLDRRRVVWLGAALLAFILSVASKPAAVVFPLTLLAIDYFRKRPLRGAVLLEKAPFLAISLIDGILTLRAQRAAGAITEVWGPFQKLLFACYGTVMYVVKLFVPVGLSAIYPYPRLGGGGLGPEFYVTLAALAVLLPAALYLGRRNRVILFGLAFFFLNIVLVLQFFAIGGAVMADRYTYLSYIGLLLALTWWLDERAEQLPRGLHLKPILAAAVILLVPASAFQTWKRCGVWRDAETLWNDTIQKYPHRIADAYNNRGYYYYHDVKRYDAAVADFDQGLALNDKSSKLWVNKGNTLAEMNQNDSALACFNRAIQIQPDDAEALNNRGALWLRKEDLTRALADFSRAIELNPAYRDAYANRSLAFFRLRECEKSVADSRRAIQLDPGHPENYLQFGTIALALQQLNRHREAIPEYDEAIRTAPPGEPRLGAYYLYRSYSWLALRDRSKALQDAQEARRLGAAVGPEYLRSLGG
jgi:tetratricopeptide (TPR) repeat protein